MTDWTTTLISTVRAGSSLDERKLAYSFHRPLPDILVRGIPKPRHGGTLLRLAVFGLRIVRGASRRAAQPGPATVLFFADSVNQYRALDGLRGALAEAGVACSFLTLPPVAKGSSAAIDAVPLHATWGEAIQGLLAGVLFAPRLWWRLRTLPGVAPAFFDKFLDVHRLLPTFLRVQGRVRPRLVVLANDHNTSCRLMAHIARSAGVPTLYLQHAQVSDQFPPLDFSFVFLDGEVALQAYAGIAARTGVSAPHTRIFLNGEKKTRPAPRDGQDSREVGLAVSPIDTLRALLPLMQEITAAGLAVRIRPHPATPPALLQALADACAGCPGTTVAAARQETVSEYLARIRYLVAGDSSIHMDALLRGVPSFYARLHSEPAFMDYYGFLRHGVLPELPAAAPLRDWHALADGYAFRVDAIRRYSATYATPWHGREEVLSARTVLALIEDDRRTLDSLYPRQLDTSELRFGAAAVRAPA